MTSQLFSLSVYPLSAKHSLYLEQNARVLDFNSYFVVVAVRKTGVFSDKFYSRQR